jgi:hypothetical protein
VQRFQTEFESTLEETRFFVQQNPEHFKDLCAETAEDAA